MKWRSIFLVLAAVPALLESELLPIRTYSTADGLAADHVECVVSDSRGFLWFCTAEGLSRFDGNHFVSYGASEGLPHQYVSSFLETRSGDHWIGTPRGLVRINSGSNGPPFATYRPGKEAKQNSVAALLEAWSGEVWCGTAAGLFKWRSPLSFRPKELPIPAPLITAIAQSPGGDLWAGTLGGVFFLGNNGAVRNFTVKDGLPGQWVEALALDSKGRLWAAIRGGLALITRQAAGAWSVEKVYRQESGLAHWDVKALLEASDGTLWVGTAYGISRLRLSESDPPVFQNLTRVQGLSDQQINALAEDPAGNIWAGTEGAGVMRIARQGFTTYRESDGLDTDRVMSVFEDRAGALLAVTTGPGGPSANVFDGTRFRSLALKEFHQHPTWGWHQVLLESRTGEWWAATKQGLCRFGATKAADLNGKNPKACYVRDSIVFRVFEDSKGGIWASAQSKAGDRLMRWDPNTNRIVDFPAPRIPGDPSDDLVSAFAEDRQGNIWMGLYQGTLYRYDGRKFQRFQTKDGLPGGPILALLAGQKDALWIGSGGGGLGRAPNTGDERPRVEVYNTERGMASNTINCLVEDLQGRIYAGTGRGVDRLDPKTGHIRHFSGADGLARGEFKSAVRDRSGSLWFATTQGLSRLTTTEDRPAVVPRVFITDLQIGGVPRPISQLGEVKIADLELKPAQNQLRVDFVGVDYEPGQIIRYSYKLESANTEWSPPRNQQTVNYAALAPGSYRFLVKAVTSEGVESTSPAEIQFTVLPPLWRRWWFESLAVMLAAALVLAAHRYRVTQIVALERMRTAIATDLHDDIGASLSQIAILSEVARVGNGAGHADEPLGRIAALARELVDSMGDIVWSIRSDPHGTESLIRRMREFALDLLASQSIAFELRTPSTADDIDLGLQARRQLFLIFKECIHNIARHSQCTNVFAELGISDRELTLTVQDNGRGMNSGEKPSGGNGGAGVPSMRRRAESLGGRVQISATPGGGCTVSIHVPARHGAVA